MQVKQMLERRLRRAEDLMKTSNKINAFLLTSFLLISCSHKSYNAIITKDSFIYDQPIYSFNPYQKIMMNTKVLAFNNQNTDTQEFIAIHDPLIYKKRKFVPANDIFIDYKTKNQKVFISKMKHNQYRQQLLQSDINACLKSRVVYSNNQILGNLDLFFKPDYHYLTELPNICDYIERTTLVDCTFYKDYQLIFSDKKVNVVLMDNEELISSIVYYKSSFTNGINPGITRDQFDKKLGIPQEYAPEITYFRLNDDIVQYHLSNYGYIEFLFNHGILSSIEIGYPKTMCIMP
jgi:hypothetical protein